MQAHTNALPLVSERAEIRQWRPVPAGSGRTFFEVLEKPEIGRDAFAFYNHGGTVAVAIVWLVLYVIAAALPFLAWSLSLIASLP